jgi:hypothetical protein
MNINIYSSPITDVDVFGGPAGRCGFRTGMWRAQRADGSQFSFYSSVPHAAELDVQRRMLIDDARRANGED